jgi:antitoxin MazE
MEVQLTRWGSSLGMRIPKELATRFGLSEGAKVNVDADGDRIVVSVARPRYRLEELLVDLTHDDLAAAFDWGLDQGREVVE